jgi:molybdate transport system substrate-binding protein
VAVAVPAGKPCPDLGDEASVRQSVIEARSIGYSTGPSGAHVVRMFERWGIYESILPRIVQAAPGMPVGTLIAQGDVELGFQQLSELIDLPGVDIVGLLPPAIEIITVFSAALCTGSSRRAEANALIAFLASPASDAAKRRHGMEPA